MAKMLGNVRPCRICGRSVRNDEESLWRREAERELADEREEQELFEWLAESERQHRIKYAWLYEMLER